MYQEVIDAAFYSREAYCKNMVGGTGGNASVRIGDDVYISPTGYTLGDIQPESFVRVPLWGDGSPEDSLPNPSKEVSLHLGIYRARPDFRAVLHLHPINSIAASLLLSPQEDMPAYVPGFVVKIGSLPQVDAYPAGSRELAEATATLFDRADCVLMRRHGIVAGAKSMKTAFTRAEDIEANAQLHLLLRGHGALTKEEIASIRNRKKG